MSRSTKAMRRRWAQHLATISTRRSMPEIRREFAEMLRREIDKSSATTLAQAQRQAEEMGAAYYALLKKDLDTVAINTDVSLQQAQRELMQVADYKQPAERQTKEQ